MAEAVVTVSMMQATGKSCRSMLHDGWLGCVLPSFWLMDGAGGGGVAKESTLPPPRLCRVCAVQKSSKNGSGHETEVEVASVGGHNGLCAQLREVGTTRSRSKDTVHTDTCTIR